MCCLFGADSVFTVTLFIWGSSEVSRVGWYMGWFHGKSLKREVCLQQLAEDPPHQQKPFAVQVQKEAAAHKVPCEQRWQVLLDRPENIEGYRDPSLHWISFGGSSLSLFNIFSIIQ